MNATYRMVVGSALVLVLVVAATPASAGPYADGLGKCLVASTTSPQKATLVRWMFAMMVLHPEVKNDAVITAAQRTALSKDTAQLFQQLLTEACRAQTLEAVKYEGASTIEASFSLLGQVAARELFAHPAVVEGMAEFAQFIDEEKVKSVLEAGATP